MLKYHRVLGLVFLKDNLEKWTKRRNALKSENWKSAIWWEHLKTLAALPGECDFSVALSSHQETEGLWK